MKVNIKIIIFILFTSCVSSESQKLTRIDLENGMYTTGKMNEGVKDGKWFTILDKMNDTLLIELFDNGVLEHQVVLSDDLRWEETMENGKRNGLYNLFQNGVLIETGNNVNDTLSGYRIFYYPDGSISEKYNYVRGEPVQFYGFYPDGKIKVRSTHFGQSPHVFFDTSGIELYRIVFSENRIDTIYNSGVK